MSYFSKFISFTLTGFGMAPPRFSNFEDWPISEVRKSGSRGGKSRNKAAHQQRKSAKRRAVVRARKLGHA